MDNPKVYPWVGEGDSGMYSQELMGSVLFTVSRAGQQQWSQALVKREWQTAWFLSLQPGELPTLAAHQSAARWTGFESQVDELLAEWIWLSLLHWPQFSPSVQWVSVNTASKAVVKIRLTVMYEKC